MKQKLLLSLAALLFASWASALLAQRTVTGTVSAEADNSPLIGATILVKGTDVGTITDVDGSFSIKVKDDDVLVVSYTGYETKEVPVAGQTTLNITLKESAVALSEIVVTGYSTQQKRDLTGAVGTVNTEELVKVPSANVTSQLQGRVAGVTVSGDGRPGSVAKVRIRGFTSLTGANDPLYIVDGVPTTDISTLNPNDIESISVLKDAGAASIYGSRAANGVILVSTKKGQRQGVRVNYDMYIGSADPGDKPDFLLNTEEYAQLQWLVYRNDGTVETHPVYGPSTNPNPTLPPWAADTDWWDVITQNALIQNHDLSFSGGNDFARFYAGLNYFNQEGIVIYNFTKRYSARLNSEFKVAGGRLTLGENLNVTGREGLGIAGNGTESSPITSVFRLQPIIPHIVKVPVQGTNHNYAVGDYGGTGIAPRLGNSWNEYARRVRNRHDRQSDIRVLGSLYADLELMEGLNFRTTFGGSYQNGYNTDWTGKEYENAENVATSSYTEQGYYNADWVLTNTLTLNRSFGAHNLLAVAGYEAIKFGIGRGVTASRAGYFSDDPAFRTVSNGAQITNAASWFNTPTTLASAFLRADYSFNNRYYLSGTIRRDGSSRFGKDNRYGTFPSVSAGIRISDFIDADFLTDLKIRGGYGTMGNQLPVDPSNQFSLFGGDPGSSNYDINGTGTSSQQGFRPTRLGNIDTKWETQKTSNFGFDADLFNGQVQLSADWYRKSASDLLVVVPLPAIYGAASAPARNVGKIKNTGLDLQLDYHTRITPDLKLNATLTFTTYNNEIVRFADSIEFFSSTISDTRIGAFTRNEVGHALGEFYGYKVIGIFQNQAEVDAAPTQEGAEPGFFRYQDTDGDGEITPDDRVFLGNPNPDFTYGLNLALEYKGFDLTAFFYGSQGNDIFNYNRWWLDFWPSFQGQKSKDLLYNSWTPERPNAKTPKASNKSNFSTNTQSTSYYVEDGSFFRLRSLQIGYTLPKDLMQRLKISNARIYVQGVNLFTITKYSGLDPDVNNTADTAFGIDLGNNPLVKTYMVGLNVGF